jgi:hypothetical protein
MSQGTDSKTKAKHKGNLSLQEEAAILSPLLQKWQLHSLQDYDLVGVYILAVIALRSPKKYMSSLIPEKIIPIERENTLTSHSIVEFEGLLDLLGAEYVSKKMRLPVDEITVIQIFNRMNFVGIKKNEHFLVNVSIVLWACGEKPYFLLHSIPSPEEVLNMQADNKRVITLFLSEKELSSSHTARLHYMKGSPLHSREPLAFLIHDMTHMAHFTEPNIHAEQIGFFKSFGSLTEKYKEVSAAPCSSLRELFVSNLG